MIPNTKKTIYKFLWYLKFLLYSFCRWSGKNIVPRFLRSGLTELRGKNPYRYRYTIITIRVSILLFKNKNNNFGDAPTHLQIVIFNRRNFS